MVKHWALKKEWRRHQVQTLRWRLYQIEGQGGAARGSGGSQSP
jgi:hypothetical protein